MKEKKERRASYIFKEFISGTITIAVSSVEPNLGLSVQFDGVKTLDELIKITWIDKFGLPKQMD